MSKKNRTPSQTSIYHIIFRGINQQIIFEEDYDYTRFLQILGQTQQNHPFELYAYCLMDNHIHLLIKAESLETLETIVKSFTASFVFWYNAKYKRSGHLFQARFYSEAVESTTYFLNAIRYIHNNPVNACITNDPNCYAWSSSRYYSHAISNNTISINTQTAIDICGSNDALLRFLSAPNNDQCLDVAQPNYHVDDESAKDIILQFSGCTSLNEFILLPHEKQTELIREFRQSRLSIRQISRLCGISRRTIERIPVNVT